MARKSWYMAGRDEPSLFAGVHEQGSPFVRLCDALQVSMESGWRDSFGTAIRAWATKASRQPIRTVSLFSGAGGLDIGFHDAGFDIMEMVEINPNYARTLELNARPRGYFGHGIVLSIDIHDYHPLKSGWHADKVDLVIGGPPCQTFSAGGRRAGGVLGTTEKRGRLFQEYVRILRELRPRAFVFENVYGVTGAEGGAVWDRITDAFASAGYTLSHRILDSADYGVPQHRERMIIVGLRKGVFRFPRPTHGPDSPGELPFCTAGQAVRNVPAPQDANAVHLNGKYAGLLEAIPPGLNYSFYTEKMGHPRPLFAWRSKFSDFLYKADPHWPVRTVKAFCGKYTGPFHWENRRFTIPELKRLQTFPDRYEIEGSRGVVLQQIGNSVPPQMARALALAVLDQVFGVQLPVLLPTLSEGESLGFRTRKKLLAQVYEKRAREAVLAGAWHRRVAPRAMDFTCSVDANFRFHRADAGLACHVCMRVKRDRLVVTVHRGKPVRPAFVVTVQPAENRRWVLPVKVIDIGGGSLDRDVFLCGWKAAEIWMAEGQLKDDWVQLCGYFAYEPAIRCAMSVRSRGAGPNGMWQMLARVVAGSGVRETLPGADLAVRLGIEPEHLGAMLLTLKSLGYEVRSHKTNPQLPPGAFLIPYSFPTYTNWSVQLHKDLF